MRAGGVRRMSPEDITILVIDDSHEVRESIRGMLEERGYECLLAENGEEGIETARSGNPDLIILDMSLPRLNGMEVLKLFRAEESFADTPILMLSRHSTSRDKLASYAYGVNRFASKPVLASELFAQIDWLLNHKKTKNDNDGKPRD